MAGIDDSTFVPIISAEHASSVVLAMRSRNRRLGPAATSPTLVTRTADQQCEQHPVGPPAGALNSEDGDVFALHQFNDVVRQELQVLRAREGEEEQHGSGYWGDNTVVAVQNDDALGLRLRHNCNHRASYGIDGRKRETSTPLLSATPPGINIDGAVLCNGAALVGSQRPVNARHAPVCPEKKQRSTVCSNERQQDDDETQEDEEDTGEEEEEEEEEDGKVAGEDGAVERVKTHISPQEVPVSNPFAADDIDAAVSLLPTPFSPGTTCGPDNVTPTRKEGRRKVFSSTVNKKELNRDCRGRDITTSSSSSCTNATKGRTIGSADTASSEDESWSSSEGDRGEVFGSSSSRRPVSLEAGVDDDDDWAGTAPYGSDDEGFIVEGARRVSAATKSTSSMCRTQSTRAAVAATKGLTQPEATHAKRNGLSIGRKPTAAGSDVRRIGKHARFLSPPLVKKVGRNESIIDTSSTRNGNNANNTANTNTGSNHNRHGGTAGARAVSEIIARQPCYPGLPRIRTGSACSSAPSHTKTRASSCSREKKIGVGLAEGNSSGGKEWYVGRGGDDHRKGRETRCPRANTRNAHDERGSSCSARSQLRYDKDEISDGVDDEWVVTEFQARVEAARLEEELRKLALI